VLYSYTQISQYLACPRRYRHRYLDGWVEKDVRASMLFGRAFERALAAYFLRQDSAEVFYQEWAQYREQPLSYSRGDTWDRMLEQAIQLLNRFCQEDRVRIRQPGRNLQIKFIRPLSLSDGKAAVAVEAGVTEKGKRSDAPNQLGTQPSNEFVAYVDAIGELDGRGCLLEWKTSSARYPEELPLSASQWHPLPPEPLHNLPLCGFVSQSTAAGRIEAGAPPRSRKLWCV
jgi:hypothetical protein